MHRFDGGPVSVGMATARADETHRTIRPGTGDLPDVGTAPASTHPVLLHGRNGSTNVTLSGPHPR